MPGKPILRVWHYLLSPLLFTSGFLLFSPSDVTRVLSDTNRSKRRPKSAMYWRMLQGLVVLSTCALLSGCGIPPPQPVSPPPTVVAGPLMDVIWRIDEILVDGELQEYEFISPVRAQFDLAGGVYLWSEDCFYQYYHVTYAPEGSVYRLKPVMAAALECAGPDLNSPMCEALWGEGASAAECRAETERQVGVVDSSFGATTQYVQDGDFLTLTGEGIEMRLVRWNEEQ